MFITIAINYQIGQAIDGGNGKIKYTVSAPVLSLTSIPRSTGVTNTLIN